jgi:hypothetical protein
MHVRKNQIFFSLIKNIIDNNDFYAIMMILAIKLFFLKRSFNLKQKFWYLIYCIYTI